MVSCVNSLDVRRQVGRGGHNQISSMLIVMPRNCRATRLQSINRIVAVLVVLLLVLASKRFEGITNESSEDTAPLPLAS
jgi:hypothetical protein